MVNQVGRPAMFEGKRFLPLTKTPIWKMARSRTVLAVWEPDPLTVATWMDESLILVFAPPAGGGAARAAVMGLLSHRGNGDEEGVNTRLARASLSMPEANMGIQERSCEECL